MAGVGNTEGSDYGKLAMLTDRERPQLDLFRPDIAPQKNKIRERVRPESSQVGKFTVHWASQPDDMVIPRSCKTMLFELEEEGALLVFDRGNIMPAPASSRPSRKGAATLGDDDWLRLP